MMNHISPLIPVLAALLLVSVGSTTGCSESGGGILNVDSAALKVGIAGEVRKSPINPVGRPGVDNSALLAGAHITIRRDPGTVIGQAVSDSAGRFFVELEPATYTLIPEPFGDTPFPTPSGEQQVVVAPNAIVYVRIDYDTGIR